MDKLYTIAGTSTFQGHNTFRVATGKVNTRAGVLRRNGHTDIQLRELPEPMLREAAVAWLKAQGVEAVMPSTGGKKPKSVLPQQDAHVVTWEQARAAKAEWVAKMAAARAAKRAAQAA